MFEDPEDKTRQHNSEEIKQFNNKARVIVEFKFEAAKRLSEPMRKNSR
jgi:hypothetical protein